MTGTGQPAAQAAAPRSAAETVASLGSSRATGLRAGDALARLEREGPNEVLERPTHPLRRFAAKFWSLSAWMLELIAGLSFVLHKWMDAWVALGLLVVNAVLSFLQEQRASTAVAALRRRLQVTARVLRDGAWQGAPARELVVGDIVRVRDGDFVPADVQIIEGAVRIDQSALTGESREVARAADELLYSGSVVRRGEATGVVVATGARTYFGRTTELVALARPRLHVEQVVTRVVKWLFLVVGALVVVAVFGAVAAGLRLIEILPLTLVLLMSAVPVALPVMFTVSMAVGSIELGRKGVLITRLSAAEDAANMDVLCADKTGTLTMNRLAFTGALPEPGFTEQDVIRDGALASNEANQDPIDLAFLGAARVRGGLASKARTVAFTPFSPSLRRTEAIVELDGRRSRLVKGALRTVAAEAALTPSALGALEARANREAEKGFRVLAVARADGDGPLRLIGLALLYDAPRADSRALIDELRSLGVSVKMLTGDALPVAREIGRELGMGEIVRAPDLRAAIGPEGALATSLVRDAGGFAEVFPEDKFLVVKSLQAMGHVVGMTGDGVNDAPALRQAEVGIGVSGATDVAKAAASVVLTSEGMASIVELVKNGRAIYQRVLTWIVNKVSRTVLKAGFVVVAFLFTGKFVISALGMVLLVFMTDFAKIALSTDRVRPSSLPETWDIGPLVRVSVVLGLMMLAESLGLLAMAWRLFDLGNGDGRLETFSFQALLYFALFSVVSIRERHAFWSSRPGTALAVALVADALVGGLVGALGVGELRPLPPALTALVVGYASVCCLGVNDAIKTVLVARALGGRHARAPIEAGGAANDAEAHGRSAATLRLSHALIWAMGVGVEEATEAESLLGQVVADRWRLVKKLGEGGMGAVFLAEGVNGEGERAIKILHKEFIKEDQVVSRFYAEAKASQRLAHPNIAQVFESGQTPWGAPYLLMELLRGKSLADYVPEGTKLPADEAARIIRGVLVALGVAHAQDIIHRDLKPDNVFLSDAPGGYSVKLLDFGIARVIDEATGGKMRKTATGMILGTPGYMSPEQLRNSKSADARSDLWSLATVFYELLTGRDPYGLPNDMQRMMAIFTQDPIAVDRDDPSLSPWRPFFERGMQRDVNLRFQSAAEMDQAIEAIASGRAMAPSPAAQPAAAPPAAAPPARAQAPAAAPAQPGPPAPAPPPPAPAAAPSGKSPALFIALGVVGLVVVVGGIAAASGLFSGPKPGPAPTAAPVAPSASAPAHPVPPPPKKR